MTALGAGGHEWVLSTVRLGDAGDEGGGVVRVRDVQCVHGPDGVVDQTLGGSARVASQVAAQVVIGVIMRLVGAVAGKQQPSPAGPGRYSMAGWPQICSVSSSLRASPRQAVIRLRSPPRARPPQSQRHLGPVVKVAPSVAVEDEIPVSLALDLSSQRKDFVHRLGFFGG